MSSLDSSLRALRAPLRGLLRSPGLSLAATLCIALGAAATTSVATLANAVLVRPVPFPDADRLLRVWLEEPGVPRVSLSIPESREIHGLDAFDKVSATARVRAVTVLADGAQRLRGESVDRGYFETLGLRAAAGRLLTDDDHRPDAPPAVILSHGLWTRSFGASPAAIGTILRTQRSAFTIVGVASRGFTGTVEDDEVEFWIPIEHHEPRAALQDRTVRQTWIIARLAAGTQAPAASAQLDALTSAWRARDPERYRNLTFHAEPLGESWRGGLRRGTGLLVGAAAALLAIGALNVGCLLLARVMDRRREFAVRVALGASRGRIIRQLVLESAVMCAAGGLLGLVAGPALLKTFLAASPVALPGYLDLTPDARVAIVAIAALTIAALAAGTAPALVGGTASQAPECNDVLQLGSRGTATAPGERRWVAVLIAAETALTLVLLVSGSLLLRSYDRLASADLGFRRDGIARLAVTFSRADAGAPESRAALLQRLREAIASVPGVESSGLIAITLPPWDPDRIRVRFDGLDARVADDGLSVAIHMADGRVLQTLGIPLRAGRAFMETEPAPVAIVSEALAMRMGGAEAALGRTITFADDPNRLVSGGYRVVGVVGNVAYDGLSEQETHRPLPGAGGDVRAGRLDAYVPLSRFPVTVVSVAAATSGSAGAIVDPVRRAIGSVAPTSAVHWVSTMADEVALEYAPARFYSVLVAAFSSSAMLLTGVGLFALLWNAASRRTGEMGLRFALGASRRHVALLVIAAGARPVLIGSAAGLLGALWAADAVKSLLYEVPPFDALSFSIALSLLMAVALAAALLPARRAASVDPMVALRAE
jgi:putative ABC transport system permease protein